MTIATRKSVTLDPETLVTTCRIEAEGRGDLALLADYVDPLGLEHPLPRVLEGELQGDPRLPGGIHPGPGAAAARQKLGRHPL